MSLSLVQSRALVGLEAAKVNVEVHLSNGLPSFTLVGLADVEVKQARVSAAPKRAPARSHARANATWPCRGKRLTSTCGWMTPR